uniref:Uncharacterized protein n=1 Tax=Glossina austeni TaxID=7395 RepID=A0A1A9VC31_GLOAU
MTIKQLTNRCDTRHRKSFHNHNKFCDHFEHIDAPHSSAMSSIAKSFYTTYARFVIPIPIPIPKNDFIKSIRTMIYSTNLYNDHDRNRNDCWDRRNRKVCAQFPVRGYHSDDQDNYNTVQDIVASEDYNCHKDHNGDDKENEFHNCRDRSVNIAHQI